MNLTKLKESSFAIRGPITLFRPVFQSHELYLADTKKVGYNVNNGLVAFCDGKALYVAPSSPDVMSVIHTCQFEKIDMKVPFSDYSEPANPLLKKQWNDVKALI